MEHANVVESVADIEHGNVAENVAENVEPKTCEGEHVQHNLRVDFVCIICAALLDFGESFCSVCFSEGLVDSFNIAQDTEFQQVQMQSTSEDSANAHEHRTILDVQVALQLARSRHSEDTITNNLPQEIISLQQSLQNFPLAELLEALQRERDAENYSEVR